jgi:hypothetical protein
MNENTLAPADALLAFETLISTKRLAFRKPLKIAVAIAEHGTVVFDTRRESIAEHGWDDHADLSIFANAQTMSDLLLGTFDPAAPGSEHLLLWSGEEEDWRALIGALSGGSSMVDLRASVTKPRR